MKDNIIEILSKTPTLPVLFVGSGVSRRYLDTPDWEGLLKHFSTKLSKPYAYYHNKAERDTRDNPDLLLPTVADYIENDFIDIWYSADEYSESRLNHQSDIDNNVSPFKIAIADYFSTISENFNDKYNLEIEQLKAVGSKHISCIITTNYDMFFEEILADNDFKTYIGQNELLFSPLLELAEIYKIHGCCSKPESIIINKYDYDNFISRSSYLSAKILTIFLENPIIFMGYSISDTNIKMILESISNCLDDNQLNELKNRMIFIEWNNSASDSDTMTEKTINFKNGKSITMKSFYLSSYTAVFEAILSNQVKYEVKALRRIKSQLYELVKTNKPTEKLYVATGIDDDSEDVDFVVGVGVYGKFGQVGYRGLQLNDLYRYVLGMSELQYDENMILQQSIPELFNGRSVLPVCKLISSCQDISYISERAKLSLSSSIKDMLSDSQKQYIKNHGYFDMESTILDYYNNNNLSQTLSKIPILNPQQIDLEDLFTFICKAITDDDTLLNSNRAINNPSDSALRKCISIWDWLKYHSSANKNLKKIESN